jgi:hypothetical protein
MVDFQASHIDYLVVMVCLMVASAGRMMKMKKTPKFQRKLPITWMIWGTPPFQEAH